MMTANDTSQDEHFELQEAIYLINATVVGKRRSRIGGQEVAAIGRVVGVLTLNEEIEVVVKFIDRVSQFTKPEFEAEIEAVSED